MKKNLVLFVIMFTFMNCNENDFLKTKIEIETNQEIYSVNEKFELTITVSTSEKAKKIRILKNFGNFNINFKKEENHITFHQALKQKFIEFPSSSKNEKKFFTEITITEEKPFKKTFYGTISELNNKIIFEIPSLNVIQTIDKITLIENSIVLIEGSFINVFDSIENTFIPKEINVLIDK